MQRRVYRIMKHHDVAAPHPAVGHEIVSQAASPVAQLIDQQVVADQQCVFHGRRRNLERLHDERDYKNRDHHRSQQRLQRARHARSNRPCSSSIVWKMIVRKMIRWKMFVRKIHSLHLFRRSAYLATAIPAPAWLPPIAAAKPDRTATAAPRPALPSSSWNLARVPRIPPGLRRSSCSDGLPP